MKKFILIIMLVLFTVVTTGCLDAIAAKYEDPVDPEDQTEITFEIAPGTGAAAIAENLEEQGLIQSAFFFKEKAKSLGLDSKFQAGTYVFTKAMTPEAMIRKIANGEVYIETTSFTIPEGFEVVQIVERLVNLGLVEEEAFIRELEEGNFDYPFLMNVDRSLRLEGFLFPDTYEIKVGASEHEIIDRMLKRFDQVFKEDYYQVLTERNITMNELITMASIIEREAKLDEERPIISSVFYNRVDIAMPLQSCATVQFVLGERKENLTYDDIAIDSPYNTYIIPGLPPGPIASPGEKSIIAAVYPAETSYLYFVTTEHNDGSHYFSETLDEHNMYKNRK